jgi:hypothetical protein
VSRLAGFAGESLELGRPLTSLHRGADDLTSLFLQPLPWLGPFSVQERDELTTCLVCRLLEKARTIINLKSKHVLAIADALKVKNHLSKSEIDAVIAKAALTEE